MPVYTLTTTRILETPSELEPSELAALGASIDRRVQSADDGSAVSAGVIATPGHPVRLGAPHTIITHAPPLRAASAAPPGPTRTALRSPVGHASEIHTFHVFVTFQDGRRDVWTYDEPDLDSVYDLLPDDGDYTITRITRDDEDVA